MTPEPPASAAIGFGIVLLCAAVLGGQIGSLVRLVPRLRGLAHGVGAPERASLFAQAFPVLGVFALLVFAGEQGKRVRMRARQFGAEGFAGPGGAVVLIGTLAGLLVGFLAADYFFGAIGFDGFAVGLLMVPPFATFGWAWHVTAQRGALDLYARVRGQLRARQGARTPGAAPAWP